MGYACKLGKGGGIKGEVSFSLSSPTWSTGTFYNIAYLPDNKLTIGLIAMGSSSSKVAYISICAVWKGIMVSQYQMISGHMTFRINGNYLQGNQPWSSQSMTNGYAYIS